MRVAWERKQRILSNRIIAKKIEKQHMNCSKMNIKHKI